MTGPVARINDRSVYGRIKATENREAADIWRRRNDEPDPCQPYEWSDALVYDPADREDVIGVGSKLWSIAAEELPPRLFDVLKMRLRDDMTLAEVAAALGVTRARTLQLEQKALRLIRLTANSWKDAVVGRDGKVLLYAMAEWSRREPRHPVYAWERKA